MKSNFKIILMVVFIVFVLIGVLTFAGVLKLKNDKKQITAQGTVVLWGTFKKSVVVSLLEQFNNSNKTFNVKYVQKFPDTFNNDLLEALAAGNGPDMFFMSNDLIYDYSNKIFTIPYASYPLISFKDNYISAGEVFLTSKGILAFPMTVDPFMMYYNRSILDTNNIIYPPKYWDEFVNMSSVLTKKNENKQIVKSAVALGQFSNITNAKDIIATLFMQAGSKIVNENKGFYSSDLSSINKKNSFNLAPILSFYTSFSDPLKENYSWNRSLPYSRDFFSADKLAFYFGFASELKTLINKNPNQNFAVTQIPQIKNTKSDLTYARVTGIAISSSSKNLNTALVAAGLLSNGDFALKLAKSLDVAPARRDLLVKKTVDNAYEPAFYSSSLFARSWIDPSVKDTDDIFRGMIDKVLSNSMSPDSAVLDAGGKLNLLLKR